MSKPDVMLWLDENRGISIPQVFAESFKDRDTAVSGVSDETWEALDAGPDHEWYWEAWESVLNNAVVTDEHGTRYRLWQDGDLWLVPEGMMYDDATDTYVWPAD